MTCSLQQTCRTYKVILNKGDGGLQKLPPSRDVGINGRKMRLVVFAKAVEITKYLKLITASL